MGIYVEREVPDFWQLYRTADGSYLDPMGPKNCQTHSAARSIMRANEGVKPAGATGTWPPTGYAIRRYTGDTSGGTNHTQMASVAALKYNTVLNVRNGYAFDNIIDLLEETRGIQLSVWYEPILESVYRGSFTFRGNHEIFIGGVNRDRRLFTGVIDPLADGRQSGLYKGPGNYPFSLLREAAGMLNIAASGYRPVGYGKAYYMYGRPTGDYGVVQKPAIDYGGTPMNLLDGEAAKHIVAAGQAGKLRRMALKKGQPIYKWVSARTANEVARMSRDMLVLVTGTPAQGWRTVVVSFDGYTWEAYVPNSAGQIIGATSP